MQNSFGSEQAPEPTSANMREAGWSGKGKLESQLKKLESVGISNGHPNGHNGHFVELERSIPLSCWRASPRTNICAGAEGWLPSGWAASSRAGSVFPGGIQPLEQKQSLFLAEKARNTAQFMQAADVKTILNPGRARHEIFFTQFPIYVRNRVVFSSTQFVVLFNFI